MTKKEIREAVEKLNALKGENDPEGVHIEADVILLSLVPEEVREAYKGLGEFWYA